MSHHRSPGIYLSTTWLDRFLPRLEALRTFIFCIKKKTPAHLLLSHFPRENNQMFQSYSRSMDSSSLTGSIPSSICNLTNLHYLYYLLSLSPSLLSKKREEKRRKRVSYNSPKLCFHFVITGKSQGTFWLVPFLHWSETWKNSTICISIPQQKKERSKGELTHLTFDGEIRALYSNSLTGSIPTSIGSLTSLIFLYFSFSLSFEKTFLRRSLKSFNRGLSHNYLSGTLPSSMKSLQLVSL